MNGRIMVSLCTSVAYSSGGALLSSLPLDVPPITPRVAGHPDIRWQRPGLGHLAGAFEKRGCPPYEQTRAVLRGLSRTRAAWS